jgi:ClpP class serine protease
MPKALDAILAMPWAIQDGWLEIIASIAERESEYSGNLEALEKKLGRPLANTYEVTVRDGIATIPVSGPLFRHASLFTMISGATSYDLLARDFTAALEDPTIRGIVLLIDSPGGEVNGASDLAQMIRAARGVKPIVAFAGGSMASAAYWIGSAADRLVASNTAMIGSIGAQMGMTVREPRAGEKSYRFVSSQSPNKNASPETEAGAAQAQAIVDDIAKVFIETVAGNRGITSEKVLENYGQGAVFLAEKAMANGMIDAVGTYEGVLASLKEDNNAMDYKSLTAEALAGHRPDLVKAIGDQAVASIDKPNLDDIRAAAAAAERDRLSAIEGQLVPGAEAIIAEAKLDPKATAESTALKVLAHLRANPGALVQKPATTAMDEIKKTEAELDAPDPAAGKDKADPLDEIMANAAKAGIAAAQTK